MLLNGPPFVAVPGYLLCYPERFASMGTRVVCVYCDDIFFTGCKVKLIWRRRKNLLKILRDSARSYDKAPSWNIAHRLDLPNEFIYIRFGVLLHLYHKDFFTYYTPYMRFK
jgi:hypothetical protein